MHFSVQFIFILISLTGVFIFFQIALNESNVCTKVASSFGRNDDVLCFESGEAVVRELKKS